MIHNQGYLAIYGNGPPTPGAPRFGLSYDYWGGNATLPAYNRGDVFVPTSLQLVGGATTAPALLSETELLTAMDKHGIGTDATQAAHIEKVCGGRGYAEKLHDGRLAPTLFGEALVAAYESIGMVRLRGRMRKHPHCTHICALLRFLRCAFLCPSYHVR
jgi:DNA topoisomerase-3